MRTIRYIVFAVVIIVFLIASMITIISGGENIPVVIATAVLVVISFPSTTEWIWDKIGPAQGFGIGDKQPSSFGTVEDYLNGRLRAFADEEKRFIPLALTLKSAYQEGNAKPTDDIDAIFHQNNGRFILIGDPGSGKSTTMRHLMRQAINNYLRYPKDNRIPVWINLGEGANPVQPEKLLKHWWDNRCYLPGKPDQHISQHNLVLFLDGLNEMPLDTRNERAKLLREFLERNSEVKIVVSCRIRDYEDDEALKLPLPIVSVLPLNDQRVQDFILRNGGDENLWNTINQDEALRSLAANPYNLYQIIKISTETDGQELPHNLNELYRRYLQVTYKRYTKDRKNKRKGEEETPLLKLPQPKLDKRLQNLAFAMLSNGKGTSTDLEWALYWQRRWRWGQQAIRDGINLGVLVGDGRSLRFFHQSLHGYFAIEPLGQSLTIKGGVDRFTKNPVALIRQIGDLGESGLPAVEPLIKTLGDKDVRVRGAAAQALGAIKDNRAVEPLIGILSDADEQVRKAAASALGVIKDNRAVEPLKGVLSDTDEQVRKAAASALGEIKDNRAVEPLIKVLADTDKEVRKAAASALGKIGELAVESLIGAMGDTNFVIRRASAKILGVIKDKRAVEPLINLLTDRSGLVRGAAAQALGMMKDKRAVEPLTKATNDKNQNVQNFAYTALERLGVRRSYRSYRL